MNQLEEVVRKVESVLKVKFRTFEICDIEGAEIENGNLRIGKEFIKYVQKRFKLSRKKALLRIVIHEGLHLKGMNHDYYGHKVGYYSVNTRDYFSTFIMKLFFEGK